jgi:hypothetical protein
MYIAQYRQMVWRRLQVLTDGQHLDAVRAHVAHDREDLVVGFTRPTIRLRLRRQLRKTRL